MLVRLGELETAQRKIKVLERKIEEFESNPALKEDIMKIKDENE